MTAPAIEDSRTILLDTMALIYFLKGHERSVHMARDFQTIAGRGLYPRPEGLGKDCIPAYSSTCGMGGQGRVENPAKTFRKGMKSPSGGGCCNEKFGQIETRPKRSGRG